MRDLLVRSDKKPDFLQKTFFFHPQDKNSLSANLSGYELPGIIDIHLHGAFGWDFSFGNPDKINNLLDLLLMQGVTGVVPTLITCPEEQRCQALKDIAQVMRTRIKPPLIHGINLEGPFLASEKRGSHPAEFLLEPDYEKLKDWQEAAEGNIKIITIAPELPGALELIKQVSNEGIICALGHSQANWEQTEQAIAAGACHATHLFNAMPGLHHREANLLSCILASDQLNVELIADGIHIVPETIKLAYNIFDNEKLILVSDCVATTGMQDGEHELYGRKLQKNQDSCRLKDGKLFGGSISLSECIKRLGQSNKLAWGFLGTAVWRNPCKLLQIEPPDTKVFFDQKFNWLATRSNNEWYWQKK
jgi:N-acetylglucosamine-6-phosphate deacetylase